MLGARLREDARRGPHQASARIGGGGALAAFASARQRDEPDLAFGALQTGFYLTAFGIAVNRIELISKARGETNLALDAL
jgi:hypothetical protein